MAIPPVPPTQTDANSPQFRDWLLKLKTVVDKGGGGGGSGVQSISAGTNITITGSAANPIINANAVGTVTNVSGTGYVNVTNNTTTPVVSINVPIHKFTAATTAPSGPINGDRWFDTSTGIEYTWLTISSSWVEI